MVVDLSKHSLDLRHEFNGMRRTDEDHGIFSAFNADVGWRALMAVRMVTLAGTDIVYPCYLNHRLLREKEYFVDPSIVRQIDVTLDRPRHLLFRKRDIRQAEVVFEQELGKPRTFFTALMQLMEVLQQGDVAGLSTNNITVLYWLGLRHEDPTLTLEDVEDLLPLSVPAELIPLVTKLFEAWQAQTPPPPEESSEVPPEASPLGLTGPATGPLPASALDSAPPNFGT